MGYNIYDVLFIVDLDGFVELLFFGEFFGF